MKDWNIEENKVETINPYGGIYITDTSNVKITNCTIIPSKPIKWWQFWLWRAWLRDWYWEREIRRYLKNKKKA